VAVPEKKADTATVKAPELQKRVTTPCGGCGGAAGLLLVERAKKG